MKKHFLCGRRAAFISAACAALLCSLPIIVFVPYSSSAFFHSLEGNLYWICFLVVFALDVRRHNFGRSLAYGGTVAVMFIVFVIWMLGGPLLADYSQRRAFDKASWKAAACTTGVGAHSHIRLRMVDDLLDKYKLVGMSRTQVLDLLGPPTPDQANQTSAEYIYYLGPERGFISIDDEWLDIKFKDELVVSAIDRTD